MQLLYISTFMFHSEGGQVYALPSCSDAFFEKYLGTFDSVRVLGVHTRKYLEKSALVKMTNPAISVRILPANTHPADFINDGLLKKELTAEIEKAEAILIKPASRRGMMAIGIAERLHKPYMIEMTGDIHNALLQNPSRIRQLYAPVLYWQIRKAIRHCRYGLYVSQDYLQRKYPIRGKMCGCADVVLQKSDQRILERRLQRIEGMEDTSTVSLALIGFYQGNGKGVDTAIRALSRLPENFQLSVLGNGTEENRQKWIAYGKEYGVSEHRISFPKPLPSVDEVLRWLDGYDFFVLPTRSEGFGRCVAEAMSRGCPCFATNICTMPELLPMECLFELDDDKGLADLLTLYSNNRELMKEAAIRNFEKAKDYDADILRKRRNGFLADFRHYCIIEKGKNGK